MQESGNTINANENVSKQLYYGDGGLLVCEEEYDEKGNVIKEF